MLSQMEGLSLPPSCKHCRNLGLGRCLQKADRHVPNLHLKGWTFLKQACEAQMLVVDLVMHIGTMSLV